MGNPTVKLTVENLKQLQRIGHLHYPVQGEETIATLEMVAAEDGDPS